MKDNGRSFIGCFTIYWPQREKLCVFEISENVRCKPAYSATETS